MSAAHRLMKLAVVPYGAVRRERRPGVIILGYHRVGGGTNSDIDLPADVFRRQMYYVRERYVIVSMNELRDPQGLARRADGKDVVVLTFDDGYHELYTAVFPILATLQIPAIVYLATEFVETQRPFDFGDDARHGRTVRPLTWGQAREMQASGFVSFGAHTHRHVDLTRLSGSAIREELTRNQAVLEDRLGEAARHFAYPWGLVTPHVRRIVGEFFETAVRGGCGKNVFNAMDLLELWRRPVQQSDGMWFFRLKVRSFLDGEEYLRGLATRGRSSDVRAG